MPATLLSHQALVLPLKMRWPHRFSGLALCIGSMTPDFAFIGVMSDDNVFGHTLLAQLWFTVPVTMLLVRLTSELLLPTLLPYLREHQWWRVHDLLAIAPPRGVSAWVRVAISAWIGGMSHVLMDAITHGNHSGWLVPSLPFLRTMVPQIGGPVPLYDALQVWLTIALAIAAAWMWRVIVRRQLLWKWRGEARSARRRTSPRTARRLLWVCALASVQGAAVGAALHANDGFKPLAAAIAFGAIDFVFLAMIGMALVLRREAMQRGSTSSRDVRARAVMRQASA